jgi:hypothetical protein
MAGINAEQAAAGQQQAASGQVAFIVDSFRGTLYVLDQLDVQDTPIYDTLTYAASAAVTQNNSRFFTNVGTASGKTIAQTNLDSPGKLNAPEAFSVFGNSIYWDSGILRADLNSVLQSFVYEFYLLTKYYQRAPIWHFSAGAGISGATTRTSESFYTNGFPDRNSMHKLAIPIIISNQLSFYGQLAGTSVTLSASGVGMILISRLVGLYARAIQ